MTDTDSTDEAGDMKLGSETVKSFGGKLLQAALGFAGTVLFARILGPTAFGGFYFLLTLVMIADRPGRGIVIATRKRFTETDIPNNEVVGATIIAVLSFGVVAGVAAIFLRHHLLALTGVEDAWFVFSTLLVGILLFLTFQGLLGASGQLAGGIWLDTVRSVFTLAFQIAFVAAGFGAAGMGYGLAGASLVCAGFGMAILRPPIAFPSLETVYSLTEYARFSIPASFVGKVYDKLDALLIGFFIGPAVVGYYEVALKLTLPATFVYGVVAAGLMPKISNLVSRGEDIDTDVTNAVAYSSIIAIPMFFGVLPLSRELVVTAYGAEYIQAAPLLVGLVIYRIGASQSEIYKSVLEGIDRPDVGLRIDAMATTLNVIVGLVLLVPFGALGVVVATVAAEWMRYGLAARVVSHEIGVQLLPKPLLLQVIAGVVMGVSVETISRAVTIQSWVELLSIVLFGVAVYGGVLLAISQHARKTTLTIIADSLA